MLVKKSWVAILISNKMYFSQVFKEENMREEKTFLDNFNSNKTTLNKEKKISH